METQKLISRLSTRGLLPRAMPVLICECWSSDSCGAPLFSWIVSDVVPGGTLQSVCDCAGANPPNPTTAATATVANNLFLISALLCSPAKLSRALSDHEMSTSATWQVVHHCTRFRVQGKVISRCG